MRTQRGQEVVTKWPKKASKKRRAKQREREEFFRQVQWAWKFSDPIVTKGYTEAVKGTPLLPRDLFLSGLSGRLLAFRTPEGRLIVSEQSQANISETLDFLSSEPGAMLIRTEAGWVGLSPGEVDQVLTMNDDATLPEWADPTGGGGGQLTLLPRPPASTVNITGTNNVTAGTSLHLLAAPLDNDVTIHRLWLPIRGTPSGIYKPVIYDWSASDQLPASTAGATLVAAGPDKSFINGPLWQFADFATPVNLTAGRLYLAGFHKRNALIQTTTCPVGFNSNVFTSTAVTAAPPNPLPALTSNFNTFGCIWSE